MKALTKALFGLAALLALVIGAALVRDLSVPLAGGAMFVLEDFGAVLRKGFGIAAFRLILIATFVGWALSRFKKK